MKKNKPFSELRSVPITTTLRLRPASLADVDIAMPWYQDVDILKYTAGIDRERPYDQKTVRSMYQYLMKIGECYIIEIKENNKWVPIGDVTLSAETIPIVIGRKEYWGRGIAKKVLLALIQRAKEIGYTCIKVKEIYDFNERSLGLFRSLGFTEVGQTDHGISMELRLED